MPKDGYAPAVGGTGVGPGPAVPFGRRERQPSSSGDTPTAAKGGSAAVKAEAYFFRVTRSAAGCSITMRPRSRSPALPVFAVAVVASTEFGVYCVKLSPVGTLAKLSAPACRMTTLPLRS